MNPILSRLRERLPERMDRKKVKEYLADFISPKYLANLDSQGKGPKRYKNGRRVIYDTEDLLNFLDDRMVLVDPTSH